MTKFLWQLQARGNCDTMSPSLHLQQESHPHQCARSLYGRSSSLFVPLGYYRAMKSQLPGEWSLLTPQIPHWDKYRWYL